MKSCNPYRQARVFVASTPRAENVPLSRDVYDPLKSARVIKVCGLRATFVADQSA